MADNTFIVDDSAGICGAAQRGATRYEQVFSDDRLPGPQPSLRAPFDLILVDIGTKDTIASSFAPALTDTSETPAATRPSAR